VKTPANVGISMAGGVTGGGGYPRRNNISVSAEEAALWLAMKKAKIITPASSWAKWRRHQLSRQRKAMHGRRRKGA